MPITAITQQPASGSLNAAYRPIAYQVTATRTDGQPVPPVVYADLYLNGTYYRSQSHTQPDSVSPSSSTWRFDIQDLCQQALRSRVGTNGGTAIETIPEAFAAVQVRFRSSGYTAAGFVQPEGTAPVQGTGNTSPVAGTGTASNTAFAILATLQHASNQDLATHLTFYQAGTWQNAYPLTHRPGGTRVGVADSDFYPIFQNSGGVITQLRLFTRPTALANYTNQTAAISGGIAAPGAYLLPFGPGNLAATFPTVNWLTVYDYFIQALDSNGNIVATSTTNRICRCAVSDKVRVHFLNYLGQYDVLQFNRPRITHDDDGDTYVRGLSAVFAKPESGLHRWNVRANDTYELVVKCMESQTGWIRELADSPAHLLEWAGIEGQANSYLPLVKTKGAFDVIKNDGSDFEYTYTAQFVLGNPVVALRG